MSGGAASKKFLSIITSENVFWRHFLPHLRSRALFFGWGDSDTIIFNGLGWYCFCVPLVKQYIRVGYLNKNIFTQKLCFRITSVQVLNGIRILLILPTNSKFYPQTFTVIKGTWISGWTALLVEVCIICSIYIKIKKARMFRLGNLLLRSRNWNNSRLWARDSLDHEGLDG